MEEAGDLAYGRGRYSLQLPSGERDHGKYVVVYRRHGDGAWRAVVDIYNSDRSAPA